MNSPAMAQRKTEFAKALSIRLSGSVSVVSVLSVLSVVQNCPFTTDKHWLRISAGFLIFAQHTGRDKRL
jgi:hypothetical protein